MSCASADLDQGWVAVEAKGATAGCGDARGGPAGLVEEVDGGVTDGLEAGEAVGDLGAEVGNGGFGWVGGDEVDVDDGFCGDAGDVGAGGFEVGGDGGAEDEAEVDDVAGEVGVVAVAECLEELGVGEHLWVWWGGGDAVATARTKAEADPCGMTSKRTGNSTSKRTGNSTSERTGNGKTRRGVD